MKKALEANIKETGTKYSRVQLKAAFEAVENKTNWKLPIVSEVPQRKREITEEAVIFFAGCRPIFRPHPLKPGVLAVNAVGYYIAVGA